MTRAQLINRFLDAGVWHVAPGRELTRRALFEFLETLPDAEFSTLQDNPSVLVLATAEGRKVTGVPWAMVMSRIPSGCETFNRQFEILHFDPQLEGRGYSDVRVSVFEALTFAMAHVYGFSQELALALAQHATRLTGETVQGSLGEGTTR